MSKLLLFYFTFCTVLINAQIISGTIRNKEMEPVTYASIGISDSKTGAISDLQGSFRLELPENKDAKIVFSASGYLDKVLTQEELLMDPNVVMEYKTTQIEPVSIRAKEMKQKTIGQTSKPFLTFSRMFDQNLPTVEQGSIFQIFPNTKLRAFHFYIIPSSRFREITLKLNIYDVKNNQPHQSLLEENIIFKTSETGWQSIDLSSYRLMFRNLDKIVITMQLIDYESLSDTDFVFGISAKKTFSKDLLFRYQSQGRWESFDGTFISYIDISYDRSGKREQSSEPEKPQDLDDRTSQLVSYYNHKEKAAKTEFGRSKKGQFVDLKDAKIYYETYGDGEPLVLLHGNNGSISDFYRQIPFFSKNYKVIAIDTRGQGKSTDLSQEEFTYGKFAEDIYNIIQHLKLEKVNIVGWSDGGNTALTFNLKHPEMVNKLVTIGANLDPSGLNDELIQIFKQQVIDNTGNIKLIRLMLNHPEIKPKDLAAIANPVLVIAGSKDVIKPDHTRLIHSSIINSQLLIIPDTTHYVPFEKPEILNEAILRFLQK